LAAVLGHEVGHVIARHGNERISAALATQGALTAIQMVGGQSMKDKGWVLGLLGVGAQFGILMPHGRSQESESDTIGLDLMSHAGFDPRESIKLWENMGAASGGKGPPEFLSTHPSHSTRIQGLSDKMGESMAKFEAARNAGKNPKCGP
jgi:predicted Zn-dependent protease